MKKKSIQLFLSLFIIVTITSSALVASTTPTEQRPLVVATSVALTHLDPHKTYWSSDLDTYSQVVEPLYWVNLTDSDANFPIVPMLAESFGSWSTDGLTWIFPLRGNTTDAVYFTDESLFNSTVVVWNFDRMYHFHEDLQISQWGGMLNTPNQTFTAVPGATQEYNDTATVRLFKSVETAGEFAIKMTFNYLDPRIQGLISFKGFSMVSQESHSMEEPATYELIGTGPFILESIAADGTRTYVRNDDYWLPPANIAKMIWIVNPDTDSRMAGILGGENRQYDFVGPDIQYFDEIQNDTSLTFQGPVSSQVYYYAGFNTQTIPLVYRKAMAYAYNYTWLIEDYYEGTRNYMYTPVAPGIPFSKTDCDYPVLDLAVARALLIDDGGIDMKGLTLASTDQDWIDVAESSDPIAYYNISHYLGWEPIAASIVNSIAYIGIQMEGFGLLDDPMDQLINTPANWIYVDCFLLGWGPDYLDPHNMIAEAFASAEALSPMNLAGNYPLLQDLIDDGLMEMDIDLRRQIYYDQQTMIIEDIIPWIMLMTRTEFAAYTSELSNYPLNPGGDLYFYPAIWNPAEPAAPPVQAIPGYDVVALFGAIAVASMFLLKKRRK